MIQQQDLKPWHSEDIKGRKIQYVCYHIILINTVIVEKLGVLLKQCLYWCDTHVFFRQGAGN